jgi:hypothetical protein
VKRGAFVPYEDEDVLPKKGKNDKGEQFNPESIRSSARVADTKNSQIVGHYYKGWEHKGKYEKLSFRDGETINTKYEGKFFEISAARSEIKQRLYRDLADVNELEDVPDDIRVRDPHRK